MSVVNCGEDCKRSVRWKVNSEYQFTFATTWVKPRKTLVHLAGRRTYWMYSDFYLSVWRSNTRSVTAVRSGELAFIWKTVTCIRISLRFLLFFSMSNSHVCIYIYIYIYIRCSRYNWQNSGPRSTGHLEQEYLIKYNSFRHLYEVRRWLRVALNTNFHLAFIIIILKVYDSIEDWRSLQRPQCPSSHYAYCQTALLNVVSLRLPLPFWNQRRLLYGSYWLMFSFWFTSVKRSAPRNFTDRNTMVSVLVTDGPSHRILSSSPNFLTNLFQNVYYLSAEMWSPVMS